MWILLNLIPEVIMRIATFRTEFEFDADAARDMVNTLGLTIVKDYVLGDGSEPHVANHVFTVQIPDNETFESLHQRMCGLISVDTRFMDLHRCEQTLKEGDDFKDPWYGAGAGKPTKVKAKVPDVIPRDYRHGVRHPYGSTVREGMYESGELVMSPAVLTTQAIIANLDNRRGLDHALDSIDDDIRDEIVDEITTIIETMYPADTANPNMSFYERVLNEVNS
jgi:hypothetical protein